jgi:hypothetical protein
MTWAPLPPFRPKFPTRGFANRFIDIEANTIYATEGTIGSLDIVGALTLATGGTIRSAASGQRIEIAATDTDKWLFYTGDSFEALPGEIATVVSGSGGSRTLQVNMRAPATTGDSDGTFLVIRSESNDDSTSPPGVVIGYAAGGGSTQTPLTVIQDGRIGITDLGSATAPAIGIGTNHDDGWFSPADSELALGLGGTEIWHFTAPTNESRMYGRESNDYLSNHAADEAWKFIIDDVAEFTLDNNDLWIPNVNKDFTGTGDDTVLIDNSDQLHIDTSAAAKKKNIRDWGKELAAIPIPEPIRYKARAIKGANVDPRWRYGWTREQWHEADQYLVSLRNGEPHNYIDRGVTAVLGAHILDLEDRVERLEGMVNDLTVLLERLERKVP